MKVSKNAKIYVYCPAGAVTGGAELLHQLVHAINQNSYCAGGYIVYFGESAHSVPEDYKKYNIRISETIEDVPTNIVVIYEGIFNFSANVHNAQMLFWWLSVDNFYLCQSEFLAIRDLLKFSIPLTLKVLKHRIKELLLRKKIYRYTLKEIRTHGNIICHAYQSEYARDFLAKNGFSGLVPLKDYVNDDYIAINAYPKKEDIVIYNPKKGYSFTKQLIKRGKNIHWLPIQNMTREQVKNALLKSKVYIDFGYHPGKDRIPREAVMCGCCVITGKQGSAKYYGDIPIDGHNYKFAQNFFTVKKIIAKILYILEHYEIVMQDFQAYRTTVQQEKAEFESQVAAMFSY